MSRNDLIEALQLKGDRQIRRVWEEAETELEEKRKNARTRVEEERLRRKQTTAAEAAAEVRRLLLEAERQAEELRSSTRQIIAERLRRIATERLASLARSDRKGLFTALTDELPKIEWRTIFVSPADLSLARGSFPESDVEAAERILSGYEAHSRDDGLVVVNTLEKRLERSWPQLLTRLLDDVEETRCR